MNTLDDVVRLWGRHAKLDDEILENTLRAVLYFVLAGTDGQMLVESAIIGQPFQRIRLSRRAVSHGAILVRLLGNEVHPLVRLRTVMRLADLSASPHNQIKIASYFGVLDELVGLLGKAGDASLEEPTVRCLANLAKVEGNHLTMVSSSVLEPLVTMLAREEVPRVHQETARCLTNIAMSSPDNSVRIAEYPGALDALVRVLTKEEPQTFCIGVVEQTIECLKILSDRQENLPLKIVDKYSGVLAALAQLLGARQTSNTQLLALELLGSLSYRHQRNKVIVASHPGLLPSLLRLLDCNCATKGGIKVQEKAAVCLANLVSDTEPLLETTNLLRIGSNEAALKVLVKCMDSPHAMGTVKSLAVQCFNCLATVPENRWKIVSQRGVLRALVNQMVSVANPSGQEHAAWCLAKLADTQDIKIFLATKTSLIDDLITVLGKANWVTLEPAITCLSNLAQSLSEEQKERIASHGGVINAMVRLLKGNAHAYAITTELATKCLSHLAMVSSTVEEICSQPGLFAAFGSLLQEDGRSNQLPRMLEALVPLLGPRSVPDHQAQEQVASCLGQRLVAPANEVKLRSYVGAIDALRALAVEDGTTSATEDAASCLAHFMSRDQGSGYVDSQLNHSPFSWHDDPLTYSWHDDPLTYELMCDPVKCNDGVTYNRWTVVEKDIRRSPFTGGMTKFVIVCDDVDTRRRLFQSFPTQVAEFRRRRQQYRDKALESSNMLQLKVAVEMLTNVLQWDPSDTICQNELNRIRNLLSGQPSPPTRPRQRIVPTESHEPAQRHRISIDSGGGHDVDEGGTPTIDIPVVDHVFVSQTRDLWKHGHEICLLLVSVYFVGLLLAATSLR